MADLADVAYWVEHHAATGDLVSDTVAAKIADYWQIRLDANLPDDLASAIAFAKGERLGTIGELYALKDWALRRVR